MGTIVEDRKITKEVSRICETNLLAVDDVGEQTISNHVEVILPHRPLADDLMALFGLMPLKRVDPLLRLFLLSVLEG